MVDETGRHGALAQPQVAFENGHGPRAQDDAAILAGLRDILIDAVHARFGNTQHAVHGIVVGDHECNLFGRAQAGEEAQLVVVGVRVAPVAMERGDEDFRLLNAEGIDPRAILPSEASAFESSGRITPVRIIEIAEGKRASQRTDGVVIGLLVTGIGVCDLHQPGVGNADQRKAPQVGSPHVIEDLSMGGDRDGGEIAAGHARLLMAQKGIEDLCARARTQRRRELRKAPVARKFIREAERAGGNLGFDACQVGAGP